MKINFDDLQSLNLDNLNDTIDLYVDDKFTNLLNHLKDLRKRNIYISLFINPDAINIEDIPYYRIANEVILNSEPYFDENKTSRLIKILNRYGINFKFRISIKDSNFNSNLDIIYFAIRNKTRLIFHIEDSIKNNFDKLHSLYRNINNFIWNITIDNIDDSLINKDLLYDERLDIYHNIHNGKRCFVIGNGPSFDEKAANLLKNEITIGCNAIGSAFKMWGFIPTYHCFGDWRFISNPLCWKEMLKINEFGIPSFYLEHIYHQEATEAEQRLYLNSLKQQGKSENDFITWPYFKSEQRTFLTKECIGIPSVNCKLGINSLRMPHKNLISYDLHKGTLMSGSVIQDTSIPIAAWLGCNEIYLIGCDMSDTGHFYNKGKTKWSVGPDVIIQFGWMQEKLQEEGKTLYNLSPSKLPKIENLDTDSIF